MAEQIGFFGASGLFVQAITADLIREPLLEGSEVLIYDLDFRHADTVAAVCQIYAKHRGSKTTFRAVPIPEDAITNSTFVLNTAMAGGHARRAEVCKQIADTTGIYGPVEAHTPFSQLSLMKYVGELISKHNPQATLIQCSNPIPEGGTLITQETGIKFIGVCHGYRKWEQIAGVLGMTNLEYAHTKIAGINHNVWLLEFMYKRKDAYPWLKQWITDCSETWFNYFSPKAGNEDYQLSRAAFDLFDRSGGYMPIGDTPRASTPDLSRFGYHKNAIAEQRWYGKGWGAEGATGRKKLARWRNAQRDTFVLAQAGELDLADIFPSRTDWQIVPIITSISSGQPSTQIVNIRNNGAIPGLSDRLVIEGPAQVDAKGATIETGSIKIPAKILDQFLLLREAQALAHVDAFTSRSRNKLREVLLLNHKVREAGGQKVADMIIDIWMDSDSDMKRHYS
ncbi:hypothetical protein KC717_03525 [Candidatus Dojkabacteria bacterium]|uniref:Glycosyl hydrolase family 4 C-terminal domain-containing protein n=1 Tax=Candidatus Dojkabacteria bacterium TaxID=2099670 RepID=A0A955L8Q2_9BACT|nr:hypothetical protein [Candidatus Dojkabacteria bacterium]